MSSENENVFTPAIQTIVLRHCLVSAGIAIIPGVGPMTNMFNQTVMIQLINQELGVKLEKGKIWPVVKSAGIVLLSMKAIAIGASFLPGAGSVVSATIEAGATYAVAYVYVNMMRKFCDENLDIANMTDEEFAAAVNRYSEENKDAYKKAFKEGKKFYKNNKDSMSKEEVERMKAEVMAGAKQEADGQKGKKAKPKAARAEKTSPAAKLVCPNCGTALPEEAKFCAECGTPVAKPHPTHCPNCGVKLPDGAKFCVECGTKIDG